MASNVAAVPSAVAYARLDLWCVLVPIATGTALAA